MTPQTRWLLFFLLPPFLSLPTPTSAQNSLSIESDAAYRLQRTCVQSCIVWIPYRIGCPEKYTDECFCRADLQPKVSSTLSGCVSDGCGPSETVDLNNAISVYNGYCVAATAGTKPVSVDATTTTTARGEGVQTVTSLTLVTETSGGNRGVTSVPDVSESRSVVVTHVTSTVRTGQTGMPGQGGKSGSGGGGAGLSTADKIALGIGIGIGLPATIATITMCVLNINA